MDILEKAKILGNAGQYDSCGPKNCEIEKGEEKPIGLILCAEGRHEQIELLQLEKSNIKVAEYFTEVLPKELLHKKLHLFYQESKKLIENRKIDEKELL